METFFITIAVLFLVGPILAIVALVKLSDLDRRIARLKEEVAKLGTGAAPAVPVVAAVVEKIAKAKPKVLAESTTPPEPLIKASTPKPAPPKRDMENALASRWFVWVGGLAIALGGLLFVKYAHDNGLIPPLLRVVIGLVFGGALVAASEWLRRRDDDLARGFVPAALSAAGLAIAFGVVYAAYALYDILSPTACFPLLVAIALGALWLSLRQGPLIAALGLVGSYGAPALVPSEFPSVWGFFAILLVILAATLWLLRQRPWWWAGFAALVGSLAWALMWLNGFFATDQILPIGLFALASGAAATFLPKGLAIREPSWGSLADPKKMLPPMQIAVAGLAVLVLVLGGLVHQSSHDMRALLMFAIGMAALTGFGWWRDGMVAAPLAAAIAALVVLMGWPDVGFHEWAMDERGFWSTVPGFIEPPRFRNAMLSGAVAFTAVGLLGVLLRDEKRPWAALAAGSALLFLFGAWARADFTMVPSTWAIFGVVASAILVGLAYRIQIKASRAAEILLAGAAPLAVFAIDRLLDGVWMTLAVAALAALAAFSTRRMALPWLATIAAGLASFAAARLFYGREFWGEPVGLPLGAHWPLYGYGVTAALFWQASRWLKVDAFARHRMALEGLALGLAIALVSLELRVIIAGGIAKDSMGLLELSTHALAWMGAAYGLAYRQQLFSSFVSLWGARALLLASSLVLLAGLTIRNPVVTGDIVEGGRVFNALWLAYLAPVPLLALMARKLEGLGLGHWRNAFGVFALVLLMTFVTLQVKRLFQDFTIAIEFLSDAESYAVSLAWLAMAILIFIVGIKLDRQTIRYGGLAVMVATVLKVFVVDLSDLSGLWRIASLMGLGLCLIGVGWVYTRFVQKRPK